MKINILMYVRCILYRLLSRPTHAQYIHTRVSQMNLLTYLLTPWCRVLEKLRSWFAASQEIPRISRNLKVHYRTHKHPPTVSILGQPNPVHILTSHLLEIHSNIIYPSTPRSPQWSPSQVKWHIKYIYLVIYWTQKVHKNITDDIVCWSMTHIQMWDYFIHCYAAIFLHDSFNCCSCLWCHYSVCLIRSRRVCYRTNAVLELPSPLVHLL